MAKAKSMSGARARLEIGGLPIGIFSSVNYEYQLGVTPVYTLGRFSPQELAYTDASPISVTCSGFRVVSGGPHEIASVPQLQELLNHEDFSLSIFDRQGADGSNQILRVDGLRPTGYSSSVSSRGLMDLSVTFMGLVLSDESGDQEEPGAVKF